MNKKVAVKITALIMAVAGVGVFLFSCFGESNGKNELTRLMFSSFTAEGEYLFEAGDASVAGKLRITRDENVRLEFLSPDPYTGICVTGDAADNVSVLSVSYSGIKADIPKSMLSRLNMMLAMFSDTASSAIDGAGKDDFVLCEDDYFTNQPNKGSLYEANFSFGDTECVYIYDSVTGYPLDMRAVNGDVSVQIKINKLKTVE